MPSGPYVSEMAVSPVRVVEDISQAFKSAHIESIIVSSRGIGLRLSNRMQQQLPK
jgi:hypothetical protein